MKIFFKNLSVVVVGVVILAGAFYLSKDLKKPFAQEETPQETPNEEEPSPGINLTDFALKLPDNFQIEVFAQNLPGARVMEFDSEGNLWVSRTSAGRVTKLEIKDNKVVSQNDVFRNLDNPHGITFDWKNPGMFYIAEEGKITRFAINSDDTGTKIADLPTQGGGHFTRTINFGPDDRLYVSIGSSCNVCDESDQRRAAIYSMNSDGSDFKPFATGLRNTVFFDWSYVDGRMWGTDMGRDNLGDNIPPEEINVLEEGKDYGWPVCFGQNIHDTNFDKKVYIQNPCNGKTPPAVEMQAHSAPLGLGFVPEEGWPEEYWYDLIVAFHGSWNRTEPTGYKLVRVKLDANGKYEGVEDFITGWHDGRTANGRPVDVLLQPGGTMYVSDDKAGVIYKISLQKIAY